MTTYAIAEVLHKFVWEVKLMGTVEYMGWIAYFDERERKKEVTKGNIMAMTEDEIVGAFTGGD